MKVLDLFCGGGGAAEGYLRVPGVTVTGVDVTDTNNYPGDFICMDALQAIDTLGSEFDFIHASPPCQAYSHAVVSASSKYNHTKGVDEPKLIHEVRAKLIKLGKPFVIENVMGAKSEMWNPATLCGTMFGLPISRHRLFECHGFMIVAPNHPKCSGVAKRYAEEHGIEYRDMSVTGKGRRKGCSERWMQFMDIRHKMTQHELAESIPPAYTEFILKQFIEQQPA